MKHYLCFERLGLIESLRRLSVACKSSFHWHLELSHTMNSAGVTPSFCTFPLLTFTIKPWYHSRPCPEYSVCVLSCIYFARQAQRSLTLEDTHTHLTHWFSLYIYHSLSLTHSHTYTHTHASDGYSPTLHCCTKRTKAPSLPSTYLSASVLLVTL